MREANPHRLRLSSAASRVWGLFLRKKCIVAGSGDLPTELDTRRHGSTFAPASGFPAGRQWKTLGCLQVVLKTKCWRLSVALPRLSPHTKSDRALNTSQDDGSCPASRATKHTCKMCRLRSGSRMSDLGRETARGTLTKAGRAMRATQSLRSPSALATGPLAAMICRSFSLVGLLHAHCPVANL